MSLSLALPPLALSLTLARVVELQRLHLHLLRRRCRRLLRFRALEPALQLAVQPEI